MEKKIIKLFLRLALASGFLSAVADRFGFWSPFTKHIAWGNYDAFVTYTNTLNPWMPDSMVPFLAALATAAEIVFAVFLILGWKTKLFANLSGVLLLIFALSMTFSTGIKTAFDASVYSASAAAFSLALIKEKFLEMDALK